MALFIILKNIYIVILHMFKNDHSIFIKNVVYYYYYNIYLFLSNIMYHYHTIKCFHFINFILFINNLYNIHYFFINSLYNIH